MPSRSQNKAEDWTKPAAVAILKEGYFKEERGRYGPVFPRTPACYGFSVVGRVKPGREQAFRDYAKRLEAAVKGDPAVLGPLKLRAVRNDAGHPTSVDPVTSDTVHASLLIFPELTKLASSLSNWVKNNLK